MPNVALCLVAALPWLAACAETPSRAASRLTRDAFTQGRHRGMSYAHAMRRGGYGSPASAESLKRLHALGVDWISITPFGYQRHASETEIRWNGTPGRGFGETDDRLKAVTQQARDLGIRVMLKPHIWLRPPEWPGSITHAGEAAWRAWFDSYRAFILHYARLAQAAEIEALCIGNELEKTTGRDADWRRVIQEVRGVYDGAITYGATFSEVEQVPFWDAVDFIGVSAYFPLVEGRAPDRGALAAAWQPLTRRLSALASRTSRKIVFTELGYRSADFGAWRQWEVTRDAPVNLKLQADAYGAFFDAVWSQPWLAGVYPWKWFSHLGHSGPESNDYEIEGKPAEGVVELHYRGSGRRD